MPDRGTISAEILGQDQADMLKKSKKTGEVGVGMGGAGGWSSK